MNLEVLLAAAILAPPAIAFQDLQTQLFVSCYVQLEARTLLAKHVYAGIFRQDEKVCFSSSGRSSYSRFIDSNMVCGD